MTQAADVTALLQAWSHGDAEALEQLAPLVHRELRGIARRLLSGERLAIGWQPTDLVQESYVRLLDWHAVHWQNRAHFFATTARMMRRVLVDAARARQAVKRGQGVEALHSSRLKSRRRHPVWTWSRSMTRWVNWRDRPAAESGRRTPILRRLFRRGDRGNAGRVGADRHQRLECGARLAPPRAHETRARMRTDRWDVLSDWHDTWLAAPAEARAQLRALFAMEHPDLLQMADELAASSEAVDGFLETPALALAARDLAQDEPPLPEGTFVGPYRIVALLARGGMGDVYRATDPRLGRDVALKTLTKAEPDDAHAVERFVQEARVTASLDHPNIVKVFDVGMSNGRPYLVSELLEGETLRAPIGRGPVAPADARGIAAALASGLVAAHARGLVHRDLKPENIFVTRAGTAKILDFGIAKLAQDPALPRGLATLTGVILGTAGYLAPEQVKGDPVDARTDLFALGSILFELMTGQRAFAREHTIDTLHAIVHDDPPDLLPRGTRSPPS